MNKLIKTLLIKLFLRLKVEAAPLAVIVAFFIAFFWPAFFTDKYFVGRDSLVLFYPMRGAAFEMIRGGAMPLWMPYIMSGFPLLAMTSLGIGYPLTWGYLFLPGHVAEEVYVLAPYLLSPAFVYAYLRTVNCSRLGSLLAGLSFTYGGFMMSGLGQCGPFTNAVMWLPLMLIAIERSRTGRFLSCLTGAGAAYAMSVLTGHAQIYVYVGLIAAGYGAFLSRAKAEFIVPPVDASSRLSRFFRLKPLMVGLGGIAIGAGVAAFQIFETMQAHQISMRSEMSYATFSAGAFGPLTLWQSFINPIYVDHYELSAYVAPLVVIFGLVAVVSARRSSEQRLRIYFWLLVAALGLLLMMGNHTPLCKLLYNIPIINKFRHPWRHAYEWTLGASMLAAFGWDAAARFVTRAQNGGDVKTSGRWRNDLIGALLLACCVVAVVVLIRLAGLPVRTWLATLPTGLVALAKLVHTLLLLMAVWWGWRKMRPAPGGASLAMIIVFACFWEQYLWASGWWFPQNLPASNFTQVLPSARFLEGRAPEEGRIYTSLTPWDIRTLNQREPHNLSARHGFHDASGYEPLASKRYCLVFGDCPAYETPLFDAPPDPQILDSRWQGLDLLNVRFLIQPSIQYGVPQEWTEKDGVRFASAEAGLTLAAGSSVTLTGASAEVDTLSLVTMTGNSVHLPQGATVADLVVHTADGRRIERELKAGIDTAEWAYEHPGVKSIIRHSMPRIYGNYPGDSLNSWSAHRYWTKFDLGGKTTVDRVELKCVAERANLMVIKTTVYNSSGHEAFLLSLRLPAHWSKVYDDNDVQIYENPRALPRAWMAPRAEVVSAEESLRRVRGESQQPFNPRETALLELGGSRPDLPQNDFKAPAEARVVSYEPNRLAIETVADKSAVLVVSEIRYPGWEAMVDGQPAKILTADYLLRSVIVPEGKHRVEMRYTAPAARRGAIVSAFTLLALLGGAIFSTRSNASRKNL